MYKIIDNYLKKEEHLKIKTLLESDSFPWYFSKKIRKKEKIESKANRMLFMDSDIEHEGTNTTDTANRIVININYF